MLTIIEKILGVVTKLFGLRADLAKAKATRREHVVALLDKVAACLARVATDLEAGKVPHGACAELATYAGYLPSTIDDEVGPQMAFTLGQELQEAHNVEGLVMALGKAGNAEAELAKLWQAVGRMHALVAIIRAGI